MKSLITMTIAILGLILTNPVWAGTTSSAMTSTASLSGKCEVSASNINLGEIVAGQAGASGTASFTAKCTKSTSFRYYIGISQWGVDCMYLKGQNKADRIAYAIKDLQTGSTAVNNYTGSGNGGSLVSLVGTGTDQTLSFRAEIQSKDFNFTNCPTPVKAPGIGYNPFVTPDTYTDTLVFGIIY